MGTIWVSILQRAPENSELAPSVLVLSDLTHSVESTESKVLEITNLMLKQHFIAIIRTVQDLSGTFPHLLAQGQGQRSTKTALFKDLMYVPTFLFH